MKINTDEMCEWSDNDDVHVLCAEVDRLRDVIAEALADLRDGKWGDALALLEFEVAS